MFPWAAFVREPHLERLFTIISPFMELHMKLAMKANQHLERNPTEWEYLMSRDDFIQWTHYDASFSVYDEWRFRVDMFPLPSCHNCLLQSLCRFYFIWWHTAHYARGMENLFFFLSLEWIEFHLIIEFTKMHAMMHLPRRILQSQQQ